MKLSGKTDIRDLILKFLLILIPVTGLLIIHLSVFHKLYEKNFFDKIELSERIKITSQKKLLTNILRSPVETVNKLSDDILLKTSASLDISEAKFKEYLTSEFINILEKNRKITQIKFLSKEGLELARVNRQARIAKAAGELHDKSHRHYYKNSLDLKKGQIFISSIDFNTDKSKTEIPLHPLIWFVKKVFIKDKFKGMIVAAYSAREILEILSDRKNLYSSHTLLINSEGREITVSQITPYNNLLKQDRTLMKNNPSVFRKLFLSPNGIVNTSHTYLTFQELPVLSDKMNKNTWKIVSFVPYQIIHEKKTGIINALIPKGFIAMVVVILISLLIAYISSRRKFLFRERGEKETLYRELMNDMKSGVIILEPPESLKGPEITNYNKSAVRICKADKNRSEFLNRLEFFFTERELYTQIKEASLRVSSTRIPEEIKPEKYLAPDNPVLVEISVYKLLNKNIVIIVDDVSLIREAENSVSEARNHLESKIEEKTIEVIEANIALSREISHHKLVLQEKEKIENQLRQSQKMEAIGTLAGGIAHDFNNILSSILGYSELCMKSNFDRNKTAKYIKNIHSAGSRAKELVLQILSFSRKKKRDVQPIDTIAIVKETVKLLKASAPANISIIEKISCDSMFIMGDSTELHQILMNLSTNSIHAIGHKNGEITIGIEYSDEIEGKSALIYVKDSGKGISPEIRDRIFDPFFTTKPAGVGTGMGLSVVHGIVQSIDGIIKLESELNKGSEIKIFFPRLDIESNNQDTTEGEHLPTGSGNLLIVEDDASVLEIYSQMVEYLGYHVDTDTNSLHALKMISQEPEKYDLIITDRTMPGKNGIELAQDIARINPALPVILCTGYWDTEDSVILKEQNIKAVITKPFKLKDLASVIRDTLSA